MQQDPQRKKVKTLLPFPCKDLSFIRYLLMCLFVCCLKVAVLGNSESLFLSRFFWCDEFFWAKVSNFILLMTTWHCSFRSFYVSGRCFITLLFFFFLILSLVWVFKRCLQVCSFVVCLCSSYGIVVQKVNTFFFLLILVKVSPFI